MAGRSRRKNQGDHYPMYQAFNRPSPHPHYHLSWRSSAGIGIRAFAGNEPSEFIITSESPCCKGRKRDPGPRRMCLDTNESPEEAGVQCAPYRPLPSNVANGTLPCLSVDQPSREPSAREDTSSNEFRYFPLEV